MTARDVIAEALRLEHNEWGRPQPWHYANADRILAALQFAPDSVRQELAALLNPPPRPIGASKEEIDAFCERIRNFLPAPPSEEKT